MTSDQEMTPPGGGRMAVAPPAPLSADPPRPAGDSPVAPDIPSDAEEFAETVGVDPTPDEVAEYERRLDDAAPEPVSEPSD